MSKHPTPPTPQPRETTPADAQRRSWAVLVLALAAQVLVVLDISVVNTALPSIGHALDLSGGDLQWLVTAYLMLSGGGLLLGGRVSDLSGTRSIHNRSAVASNGLLHDEVLERLRG